MIEVRLHASDTARFRGYANFTPSGSDPCRRSKLRQMPYWKGVGAIQQSEMHARGLLTGSTKFRVLSGDSALFELVLAARYDAILAARKRGVFFDLEHGVGCFFWNMRLHWHNKETVVTPRS